jgi:hypothetical protein
VGSLGMVGGVVVAEVGSAVEVDVEARCQ